MKCMFVSRAIPIEKNKFEDNGLSQYNSLYSTMKSKNKLFFVINSNLA